MRSSCSIRSQSSKKGLSTHHPTLRPKQQKYIRNNGANQEIPTLETAKQASSKTAGASGIQPWIPDDE